MDHPDPLEPSAAAVTPPPLPPRRVRPAWVIAAAGVLVTGASLLFAVNPTSTRLYPPCPLHAATGLYCPGCGSTRALHQLLHGRVTTAFDLNPLLVVSLPFLTYTLWRRAFRNKPRPRPLPPWAVWALLVVVLAFGVLRNLPWKPVRWMAP